MRDRSSLPLPLHIIHKTIIDLCVTLLRYWLHCNQCLFHVITTVLPYSGEAFVHVVCRGGGGADFATRKVFLLDINNGDEP